MRFIIIYVKKYVCAFFIGYLVISQVLVAGWSQVMNSAENIF